jgi:hypothetical protein
LPNVTSFRLSDLLRKTVALLSSGALDVMKRVAPIAYHALVVTLSAAIAMSLPMTVGTFSRAFLAFWARIEHEKLFLVSIEVTVAILLIVLFNLVHHTLKDQGFAKMARGAGLAYFFPSSGSSIRKRAWRLKRAQGQARSVMVIGSTGYRSFVEPPAELRNVLENCLEAKIMLLNPDSPGAKSRANAIADPDITQESLTEQLRSSVDFLKGLKGAQKTIKLKLYSDPPHLKLAILGDYIWLRHYHTNLDVQRMPEYVFQHTPHDHGLYTVFYQYFLRRWESPDIPEYDLDTDEMVYRSGPDASVRREKFLLTIPRGLPPGRRGFDAAEAGISWS